MDCGDLAPQFPLPIMDCGSLLPLLLLLLLPAFFSPVVAKTPRPVGLRRILVHFALILSPSGGRKYMFLFYIIFPGEHLGDCSQLQSHTLWSGDAGPATRASSKRCSGRPRPEIPPTPPFGATDVTSCLSSSKGVQVTEEGPKLCLRDGHGADAPGGVSDGRARPPGYRGGILWPVSDSRRCPGCRRRSRRGCLSCRSSRR